MSDSNGDDLAGSGGVQSVVEGHGRRVGGPGSGPPHSTPSHSITLREAFWHDMCREILTTMSVESLRRREKPIGVALPEGGQLMSPVTDESAESELFDGRMAILTHGGERIPIGEVYPMLACGVNGDAAARVVSQAVECSIFQVLTPAGELYTLPVHEIRAFHALTPELMRQLEAAGRRNRSRRSGGEDREMPFGFEAYTSLARSEREQGDEDPYYPAPV